GGGANNRGSPVWADGKLYVSDSTGTFYVLDVSGPKGKKVSRLTLAARAAGVDAEIDGSPSVANGRLYFCTNDTTYCVGKPGATSGPRRAAGERSGRPGPGGAWGGGLGGAEGGGAGGGGGEAAGRPEGRKWRRVGRGAPRPGGVAAAGRYAKARGPPNQTGRLR